MIRSQTRKVTGRISGYFGRRPRPKSLMLWIALLWPFNGAAQTNVTTQHNDIARTGANINETILTPANVNTNSFGKLFSYSVDGWVYAQPLYVPGVTMGGGTTQPNSTHNVVFVATEHDSVYAFDADSNLGANASPLWKASLIDSAHGAGAGEKTVPNGDINSGDIVPEIGITGTPVIDPTTNTLYVVTKSTVSDITFFQRLHALDVTTGQEKFGGPVVLSGSVPGTGNGSSAGTLHWDSKWQNNRPGLLLLNGIVYIGFGSHGDNGPWHGWILAYDAATLTQTGAWCPTPNAAAGGIWLGGTGLAADVPAGKPYGRIFTATGNGTFDAAAPNYTNAMDYGDSIIKLDLANGMPTVNSSGVTVGDDFTPHDQANLNNIDEDQASGGVIILPDAVGGTGHQLVQIGKTGRLYVLNRENLGGYNASNTKDPGESANVGGVWGAPAYWNGNVYVWGVNDHLKAFRFANGAVTSSTPASKSVESTGVYSPTPSISANGATNGIVWSMKTDNFQTQGRAILYAHDAGNVANLLYSSESDVIRDNPGNSVKFVVPTVINGRVYVGTESQVSVYGLLNGATQAATPAISPASETFATSVQVTITESSTGATINYTTDGSLPTTASAVYSAPLTMTTTTTLNAMAEGPGLLQSPVASATFTLATQVASPTFTPAPGAYTAVQSVVISTTTPNATIYYTLDGTAPTTASAMYTGPLSVGVTETLSAIAVASGWSNSPVASGLYTIDLGGVSSINYGSGFTGTGMNVLGSAKMNGTALRLTDGATGEAAAAWYGVPANIQNFSTDFTFLISGGTTPTADGFTFTMQGNNSSALGSWGGSLGYGPTSPTGTSGIANSVAVKFDLYSNAGEGADSTGLYTNGASPTTPFVDLTGSGVDLHSGHPFHVHMNYDGINLALTITDTTTNASFSHNWPIDIPTTVGGNVAYVGFTGGTGGFTAIQDIQTWTFASTSGTQSLAAMPTFSLPAGTYLGTQTVSLSDAAAGATILYTVDGTTPLTAAGGSTLAYSNPITVSATGTINAIATASGYSPSNLATAVYTIETQVTAPSFFPAAGSFSTPQTVTLSTTTPGATIYYTTGSTPPTKSSTLYTGPITVSSSQAIQAIAAESGYFDSNVSSATYTLVGVGNPAPVISSVSPNSGTQSQSNLTVIIAGSNFLSSPVCNFGAGITVNSCVYSSATQIAANISISANAVVGTNTITVTDTDGQVASMPGGFTITANTTGFAPIFVNAGGGAYTDSLGQAWAADTGFTGGSTSSTTKSIANTADPILYQSERYGNFTYQFTVPNGPYNVTLKFAETYWTAAGKRLFNVSINGTQVLQNFDIMAASGAALTAIDKTFQAVTTTGMINIQFTSGSADLPKVSAIEISAATGVFVQVNPTSASLYASQFQQFTASVTGSSNTGVTWSMSPQAGTLTANGLYTSPISITAPQTVNITATSQADATKTAVATANLLPPAGVFSPIFVHAGGNAYTDSLGNNWSADQGFTGGSKSSTTKPIANTPDPTLYQADRYGPFSYQFTVPPGNYAVVLKFAEFYWTTTGKRMFNVLINGTQVLQNFDIVAAAGGPFMAVDKAFPVTVTGNSITLQFANGSANLPKINAIEIKQSSGVGIQISPTSVSLAGSQNQQFSAVVTGTTNTAVNWSFSPQVGTLVTSGATAGLYTAPTSITANQTVFATATSAADPTQTASAAISLVAPFSPILVRSGGQAYTDTLGQLWSADKGFAGGATATTTKAITNTTDSALYQTERYGNFSYQFAVPNGSYTVVLKFAESYWTKTGSRIFNVSINGTRVLSNFDIIAAAGGALRAVDESFPVTVNNNAIMIQFTSGSADLPKVSAIQIR
jgi:hypothetical protein